MDLMVERGKMEGMDERASDVLLKKLAGESGEGMEEAREGGSGRAGSGGIRAALRKNRGSDKAGGDGSTAVGDPEREKVGVACIHGLREMEYGRPPLGVKDIGREVRSAGQTAGARDEMGGGGSGGEGRIG